MLKRAVGEWGLTFSEDVFLPPVTPWGQPLHRGWLPTAAAAAATTVAVAGLWIVVEVRRAEPQSLAMPPAARSTLHQPAAIDSEIADRLAALELDLLRARSAERASAARAAAGDAARHGLEEQLAATRRQLEHAGADRTAIDAKLLAVRQALDAATTDLTEARRQHAADAMLLDVQDRRLAQLSAQFRESDDQATRLRQLLVANRDIRDLMGARNLHVVDVYDVDGRGKTRRAFGRAFYTEGKSLIFYAFDLASAAARPASFQAWGQREDGTATALSLGLLYSDDQTQNRWTLKFEDARVLEQIDAVFVTVEPVGGSTAPRGRKLLYAYLKQKANHP